MWARCGTHMGAYMCPYGPIWVHMGPYGANMPIWAPFGVHIDAIWAHTGPSELFWAQEGPVLTNDLLTYHVAAPDRSRLVQQTIRETIRGPRMMSRMMYSLHQTPLPFRISGSLQCQRIECWHCGRGKRSGCSALVFP